MSPDYYQVLGCKYGCTAKEIKSAYHRLLFRFHPDRNSDPSAAGVTARLNEAYSVLGDERKRALYDAWISTSQQATKAATEESPRSRPEIQQVKCAKCGRQDVTIRLSLMYYVVSLLFVTYRKGASGLWCQRCRIMESAKWTGVSGIVGWWSFPWGPVYTIQALFVNGKGGVQPRSQNAAILRVLGYQLYQQGRATEALVALRESLRLEPNLEASQLSDYLRQGKEQSTGWLRTGSVLGLAMTAVPSLLVLAIVSYGIYLITTMPSGYQTNYQAPHALDVKPVSNLGTGPRRRANDLIAELARIVESRAPVVGTHYEGTALVQDHELDRSKFEVRQLYPVADSIKAELDSATDSDGFLSSAYFNAELFALSVDVVNKIDQGRPIDAQVHGVLQLGTDPVVSRWLENSRFQDNYQTLCRQLRSFSVRYRPGATTEELSNEYHRQDIQLDSLRARLTQLRSTGDVEPYNGLVSEYNAKIKVHNTLVGQSRLRALAFKKLDLAFNRCLDPGILMSKFAKVDLASHAAEIDSLEDPTAPTQ
jgi:DnaJ domain